jgi:uncharacterized Zn finger protein
MIMTYATEQSYHRGEEYASEGAVMQVIQRGNSISAFVEGSEYDPYEVQITFTPTTILSASCTCPYDWGGWCKHIVAVLIVCQEMPEMVEEHPPIEEIIQSLSRDHLHDLVLSIADHYPSTLAHIEQMALSYQTSNQKDHKQDDQTVSSASSAPASQQPGTHPRKRQTAIDPSTFRQQAHAIMESVYSIRSGMDIYYYSSTVVEGMQKLCQQAAQFTQNGDGNNALLILEGITQEYLEHWEMLDDSDGELGMFFEVLGEHWAEALLMAELDNKQRMKWAKRLANWQHKVSKYGIDDGFQLAVLAAKEGWDDPIIQQVLQGNIHAWERLDPDDDDDDNQVSYRESDLFYELIRLRLNVLEWQGNTQAFLYLAQAAGYGLRYAHMLVLTGQIAQAVDIGLHQLTTADEGLRLAEVLYQQHAEDAAFQIAEHGLTLAKPHIYLATWLRDTARKHGNIPLARQAALAAFYDSPAKSSYFAIQDLSSDTWETTRPQLLSFLRKSNEIYVESQIAIFLYEGLIDDAIAALGKVSYYASQQVFDQVLAAAVNHRPDWVIKTGISLAERPIEEGKAKYYDEAVQRLAFVKQAYQAQNNIAGWQAYVDDLKDRHGRKYKLMGLLQRIA